MTKQRFLVRTLRTWNALFLYAVAACGGVTREPTERPDGGEIPRPDSGEPVADGWARACGGQQGETCPAGEYCFYSIEQACGAADATGVCVRRPNGCPIFLRPVCGCDGKTYGDSCRAAGEQGVSVAREGPCQKACGERNNTCDANEYCAYANKPTCSSSGAVGACLPRPDACDDVYLPVCGCDMKAYPNACEAGRAGTGVFGPAPCPPDAL
jgi:hypothetical protein